jgi:hypothetical protein
VPDDGTKMAAAAMIAASLGGLGGHTVGSGSGDNSAVTSATIDMCQHFIAHTRKHCASECAINILEIKQNLKR